MKCKNCGKENLLKAQYCHGCGHPFTEEERQAAYDSTVWGKLDKLKKAKEFATLEAITSHPVFRVMFLALLIIVGVLTNTNKGSVMRPLESEEYTVGYNQKLEEYYLFTEKDSVAVPLYLPGKPEKVRISADKEEENIFTREYALGESPVLTKDPSVIYTVYGVYEGKEEKITILLYDGFLFRGATFQ